MNILIVEDNKQMLRTIRTFVADLVEEIYECRDGAALTMCGIYRPDWVLIDLETPQVNGFEATKQIKAVYPEAHVVLVTNYDEEDLRAAALEAGACALIAKEDLLAVRDLLVKSRERTAKSAQGFSPK